MKKTIIFTFLFTVLILSGCTPQPPVEFENTPSKSRATNNASNIMNQSNDYIDVTPEEAKNLIESNPELVIIDVSPNYANGHLPGAINYYVGDGSLDKAIPTLDKDKEYLVYCHVDSASILGAQKLIDAGFEMVYRLSGNFAAWVEADYPIEK